MPTILVADDNSNIQKMVANALKDKGIEVIGVANGDAAIKKLEILNPDMVLADVFMPVKDGYELCEWIKGRERLAAVPVFLLVGAFDPLDEHRVQAVKADGVLKKPFVPPDHLIGAISAMLERSAKVRAAAETAEGGIASVQPLEDTQRLTDEEIAELTSAQPAVTQEADLEPESEMYSTRPARLAFGDTEQPVGFDEALGEPAAAGEMEETGEPVFRPSSIEGLGEEASEGTGILEEMRQPAPDEPPIKVDFTGENVELVTSDDAEGMASFTRLSVSAPDLAGVGDAVEPALPAEMELPPPPPPMELAVPAIPEVRVPEPEQETAAAPAEELPELSWSEPAAEPAAFEPEAPAPPAPPSIEPPPPVEAAVAAAVEEVAVRPMSLSPEQRQMLVDEIVERVVSQLQPQIVHRITSEIGRGLETLQPQLLERITREVIRPMAEDMFKKKTE